MLIIIIFNYIEPLRVQNNAMEYFKKKSLSNSTGLKDATPRGACGK